MWNGFSSFQLVLGQNPNLPNVMTDGLPALDGTTSSEILAKHLNALHTAQKAFINCEADDGIRRALRHQVRAVEDVFESVEMVYYKRDGSTKWLGPGKVIFQDGRLGGVYVRVSTNRLIKCGKEFKENVGGDGSKGGAMGIDDKNRESLREVELNKKHFGGNGVFGMQNKVVGENIGQDVEDSGVTGNFQVGVNSDDL